MQLKLTNTLTGHKDVFNKDKNTPVSLYVCGITPYDYAHIGHGRVYVTFDVLVRLLTFLGYRVTYVRNVTDIDDKLIKKAAEQGDATQFKALADFYTQSFEETLGQLNCLPPQVQPRVTQCIPDIIEFIQKLITAGNAYVVDGDVYFDISTFKDYGKLSKRKLDDLLAGARVDVNEKKHHPGDFALWKANPDKPHWPSPWGTGRPGWHIECSVMANKHLGPTLDIHGGGMDLIFPHHENEIAQSEALHRQPLAHFWLHNAFVNINKEKMSKSLGNIIPLKDIAAQKDPMVLRFFYLQHHYRTPLDFAMDELDAARTAYKKLVAAFDATLKTQSTAADFAALMATDTNAQALLDALCDDLNTAKFLGLVFEQLPHYKTNATLAALAKSLLQQVLGLTLQPLAEVTMALTPAIETLIKQREQARAEKNWALADQLRDKLNALGYQAHDKKL